MSSTRPTAMPWRTLASALVALALAAGCSGGGGTGADKTAAAKSEATRAAERAASRTAIDRVTPLKARVRPDVLVVRAGGLTPAEVTKLRALATGGFATARVGQLAINGKTLGALGVNPSTFRPFAPQGTAEATPVWQALARGELVVAHDAATALKLGSRLPVKGTAARTLRLGALATTGLPDVGAIVSERVADTLGLQPYSAAVLSAGNADPISLAAKVTAVVGSSARVDLLSEPTSALAFLSGSKAARRFGAFSYRYHADGTIEPEQRWVDENIRFARLPLVGGVTCHRLMLPQLRRALQDVQTAGLGAHIRTLDGCYVPRFIARDTNNAVSLHTWGIAIDFNASSNSYGTRGDMHPQIVSIFERWGFRWGGRWSPPDAMHFELAALLLDE